MKRSSTIATFATIMLGLTGQANANGLSGANAFSCGSMVAKNAASRSNWRPEHFSGRQAYSPPRDAASTVKLRIVYEMADRVEVDHCGGTVIDSNWIVTAGHCVAADRSWSHIEVIAGDDNLDSTQTVKRVVKDAICHAGFDYQTLQHDIALIRLEKPLPAKITATALDFEGQPSLRPGELGLGHGWPVTGRRGGDRMLNQTPLQVRAIDLRSYITVTSASTQNEGMCRGESGGPLLSNGRYGRRLAGILSGIQPGNQNNYGQECSLPGYEMYFTPISVYRRWIDNVKSVCAGNPNACASSGGMAMAQAPAQSYAYQTVMASLPAQKPQQSYPLLQEPQYVKAAPSYQAVAPTYQEAAPSYQHVPNYYEPAPSYQTAALQTPNPTYVNVGSYGYTQPTYAPVAQPQYQQVQYQATQPTYIDSGSNYGTMAPIYDEMISSYGSTVYQNVPSNNGSYVIAYN